jgi:hypothetical protein
MSELAIRSEKVQNGTNHNTRQERTASAGSWHDDEIGWISNL